MARKWILAVAVVAALSITTMASTDSKPVLYEQNTYEDFNGGEAYPEITEAIESFTPQREICVALAQDGELLFQRGFGGADCEEPEKIASITKYFTADAVFKSGVDLETVIEPSRDLTVDDLLYMRIGMDREHMDEFGVGDSYPFSFARQAAVEAQYGATHPMHFWQHVMETEDQQFEPGATRSYSTLTFARLGVDYLPDIPFDPEWSFCGGGCAGVATATYAARKASTWDERVWGIWTEPIYGVLDDRAATVVPYPDGVIVAVLAERAAKGDWQQTKAMANEVYAGWRDG